MHLKKPNKGNFKLSQTGMGKPGKWLREREGMGGRTHVKTIFSAQSAWYMQGYRKIDLARLGGQDGEPGDEGSRPLHWSKVC